MGKSVVGLESTADTIAAAVQTLPSLEQYIWGLVGSVGVELGAAVTAAAKAARGLVHPNLAIYPDD